MRRDGETMSKKKTMHAMGQAAKARKMIFEAQRNDDRETASEKEDQQWRDIQGTTKKSSRAAKKREEEVKKRAEVAARKAEARRLAKQEEDDLEKTLLMSKNGSTKVVQDDDDDDEQKKAVAAAMEKRAHQSRVTDEKEYRKIVLVENTNRWDDWVAEMNDFEESIAQIRVQEYWPSRDKHVTKKIMVHDRWRTRKSLLDMALDEEEISFLHNKLCLEFDGDDYANRDD